MDHQAIEARATLAAEITKRAMAVIGYNAYHAAPLTAEIMRQLYEAEQASLPIPLG